MVSKSKKKLYLLVNCWLRIFKSFLYIFLRCCQIIFEHCTSTLIFYVQKSADSKENMKNCYTVYWEIFTPVFSFLLLYRLYKIIKNGAKWNYKLLPFDNIWVGEEKSFTASIRQEKTWGANNSVYGTYAELLQFNDCYKGIVLFCHVINKYWVFWFFLSLSPSSVVCGMNIYL